MYKRIVIVVLPILFVGWVVVHGDASWPVTGRPLDVPQAASLIAGSLPGLPQTEGSEVELRPIGEIQGRTDVSPYLDQIVRFRGVVTGSYQDRNSRGLVFYTVFVQALPGHEDGDPATSDGIALFLGQERPSVNVGDQVQVTGRVTEFFGFTEIDDKGLELTVERRAVPLPAPVVIEPPADNEAQADYFEALEGMRVTTGGTVQVVGPTYSGCGFAVLVEQTSSEEGQRRVFRHRQQDPVGQVVPVLHHSDVDCGQFPFVKSGDLVSGIAGPLIYNFDQFKIVQQATEALSVTVAPAAPVAAPPVASAEQVSIATLNLENHFDAVDDTGSEAEPKPSLAEIADKRQKLAHALTHVLNCPTIVGIQEVEKRSLLLDLAAEAAAGCGFNYDVSHFESVDSRGIDVALLTDPGRVSVRSVQLRQGCTEIDTGIEDEGITCPAGESPLFSRPPLQVDLTVAGRDYTVFVNHFKSKRGGEAETAPRRLAQAQHINRLVDSLLAPDANARIVVLGDFNDYDQSPAMLTMTQGNGRLGNVLHQVPEEQRYSFVFGGVSQLIDGILVSPALLDEVVTVTIVHVNADYPDSLADDVSPAHLAYKSTDHDLPLMVLVPDQASTPEASLAPPAEADQNPVSWPLLLVVALLLGATAVVTIFRFYHQT